MYGLLLMFLTLLTASSALAQTATLKGRIVDASGAVVPDARVILTSTNSRIQTATADKMGSYVFTGIAPGNYAVDASTDDLAQAEPAKTVLKSGTQTLDLHLMVKQVVQELTVQEDAGDRPEHRFV